MSSERSGEKRNTFMQTEELNSYKNKDNLISLKVFWADLEEAGLKNEFGNLSSPCGLKPLFNPNTEELIWKQHKIIYSRESAALFLVQLFSPHV